MLNPEGMFFVFFFQLNATVPKSGEEVGEYVSAVNIMSPKCYLLKNIIVNFREDFVLSHWEQNVFIWNQSLKLDVSELQKEDCQGG